MFSEETPGKAICWSVLVGMLLTVGCAPSTKVSAVDDTAQETTAVSTAADTGELIDETKAACCEQEEAKAAIQQVISGVVVPDVVLVNQDGEQVRFHSELVQGKIVAINFIFTTCKGICPPMSANFAQLQKQLGDRVGKEVALISVSVDPNVDTHQRLKAWRETFGGGPGWTLLTGDKPAVDRVLKEMEVFTADKNDHSPFVLLGDEAAGKWTRVHGLTAPDKLAEMLVAMCDESRAAELPAAHPAAADPAADELPATEPPAAELPASEPPLVDSPSDETTEVDSAKGQLEQTEPSQAEAYFTDVELTNQHGETMRFYSDVLKGKVVVVNSFFSTCKGSCPVMLASFAKIQDHFSDRLGKDLYLISITVDPKTDTPEVLAAYSKQWKAKPGWLFLTGKQEDVDMALFKLGHYVEKKESHSNIFIIGNEATGLWKKARGLSKADQIFPLIDEVLNDHLP